MSGCSVACEFNLKLDDLPLVHGGTVRNHHTRVWRDGPHLDAQQDSSAFSFDPSLPTILVVHALTGDAVAGGSTGWWAPVIGPAKALDTQTHQVLCINNLGSVYGSSNALDEGFPAEARVTPVDQARAIVMVLDTLKIERLELVAGGSLGGMIALSLAAIAPTRVQRLAVVGAPAASSAWVLALNHLQRQILNANANPRRGLELARQVAMVSYRAEAGLEQRQPRSKPGADSYPFAVQSYLEHQGRKLADRFSPQAYLTQIGAMDLHDLTTSTPGIRDIRAPTLVADIDSDQLFTPAQVRVLADALADNGSVVERATIVSAHGHDAFLIEFDQVSALLKRALALPEP